MNLFFDMMIPLIALGLLLQAMTDDREQ